MLEIVVVVAVVLALLVFVACHRKDRARDFEAAGPSLGMQFQDALPAGAEAAIRSMPSVARRTRNFFPRVLANPEAIVFDWTWQDDRLKDRNRATQTVVAIRRPETRLPRFLLAEKAVLGREDARAAGDEVTFVTPARWLDRYALHGADAEGLRAAFPDEAREALTLPPGLRVEGADDWVIVYRPEGELSPTDFARALEDARAWVDTWAAAAAD
ncbi:MAG: hypothetical protein AAGC67_07430 [Myxococcota bacterium]